MNYEHQHYHPHHHDQHVEGADSQSMLAAVPSLNRVAFNATVHCLSGCAVGEVLGMVIGTAIGLSNGATIALAVSSHSSSVTHSP